MEKQEVNLATYLMLPLVELTKNSFGENGSNFVNAFVTTEGYLAVEVKSWEETPVSAANIIYYFTNFELDNGNHMILYRVTGNLMKDVERFRDGAYSEFSQNAKDRIAVAYNLKETDQIIRILNADIRLRQKIADDLEVKLELVKEAKSKPAESNFIDIFDYLKFELEKNK